MIINSPLNLKVQEQNRSDTKMMNYRIHIFLIQLKSFYRRSTLCMLQEKMAHFLIQCWLRWINHIKKKNYTLCQSWLNGSRRSFIHNSTAAFRGHVCFISTGHCLYSHISAQLSWLLCCYTEVQIPVQHQVVTKVNIMTLIYSVK